MERRRKRTVVTSVILATLIFPVLDLRAAPRGCIEDQGKLFTCMITFGDLWGDREAYSDLPVAINGYLVARGKGLYLYPGKDYFLYQVGSGGIKVDDSNVEGEGVRNSLSKLDNLDAWTAAVPCPVTVSGTYRAGGVGDFATLGMIEADKTGLWVAYPTRSCQSD